MRDRRVKSAQPRPGEVPLKTWLLNAADARGLSPSTMYNYLSRGRIAYPAVRRVNRQVVFVLNPDEQPKIPAVRLPRNGEITLREWLAIEAEIRGKSFRNTQSDYYRHKIPAPPLRRVNHHVIYVQTNMPYAS